MKPLVVELPHGRATITFHGKAGVLLIVVPSLGMPEGVVDPFVEPLATRMRLGVVELPGAGHASEAVPSTTTRDLARELDFVLTAADVGTFHLFGISLGGMVAEWMAIDHGARLLSLVLASTAARGIDAAMRQPLAKLDVAAHLLSGESPRVAIAEGVLSGEVQRDAREVGRIEGEIEDASRGDGELLWLAATALQHDAREHLGEILVPTLVLTGVDDRLIPPELQKALARAIPNAEHALVQHAGHDITLDQPEETARIVEAFVRRVEKERHR